MIDINIMFRPLRFLVNSLACYLRGQFLFLKPALRPPYRLFFLVVCTWASDWLQIPIVLICFAVHYNLLPLPALPVPLRVCCISDPIRAYLSVFLVRET